MSANSGGAGIDGDTKRLLVDSVKNGSEASVVEIFDRISKDVHAIFKVLFPYGEDNRLVGTLLHVACSYKQPTLVKLFLEKGADPDETGWDDKRPLHISAELGDEESCALLISYGCTVDSADASGKTPLHLASANGEDYVVKLLIKNHADVNRADPRGWTPLHHASFWQKEQHSAGSY